MAYNDPANKWSRNLSENSQSEANRLRLIERQRQILESKRQRQQHHVVTNTRPPTSSTRPSKCTTPIHRSNELLIDLEDHEEEKSGLINLGLQLGASEERILSPKKQEQVVSSSLFQENSPKVSVSQQILPSTPSPQVSPMKMTSEDVYSNSNRTTKKAHQQTSTSQGDAASDSSADIPVIPVDTSQDKKEDDEEIGQQQLQQSLVGNNSCGELNPLKSILSNNELLQFALQPVPPKKTIQCTIIRDKRGFDRSFYPTYYMHLQAIVPHEPEPKEDDKSFLPSTPTIKENENGCSNPSTRQDSKIPGYSTPKSGSAHSAKQPNSSSAYRQVFLLCGRRRKKSKTYLIGNDPFDLTRDNCLAKLKSNVLGTQFTAIRILPDGQRTEIATIIYETNVLGFKGPRKMTVLMPKSLEVTLNTAEFILFEEWKRNNNSVMQLKNKNPIWNEETQSYVLNFHGRVTQLVQCKQREEISTMPNASFSFSPSSPSSPTSTTSPPPTASYAPTTPANATTGSPSQTVSIDDEVTMQFGRVSDKEFTCDVTWPLSLLQAFSIALSSFDSKLACE